MSFAFDRDLLVLEPNLFRDIAFSAQELVRGNDASISGTTLTSVSSDFALAEIDAGHVILVDHVPLEVIARLSATELTVSRLRADREGAAIAPWPGTALDFNVSTFDPQIEMIHTQVMRSIGIDIDDPGASITEDQVVNTGEFIRIESLGALHVIFAGASALVGDEGLLWTKAKGYRQRFQAARDRARALIDSTGDGEADIIRYLNVVQFVRG